MEGQLLSSQSEQFKNYSKSSDWLEKTAVFQNATFILVMKTVEKV